MEIMTSKDKSPILEQNIMGMCRHLAEKTYPFTKYMTDEEFNDWLSDWYEQYKNETPEEHEEYVRKK